jgi:antitoxin component of MazEF toxin-antitoxin module
MLTIIYMARFRKVKKFGNSYVIALFSKDLEDLNLKEGDEVDIEEAVIKNSIPAELSGKFENE